MGVTLVATQRITSASAGGQTSTTTATTTNAAAAAAAAAATTTTTTTTTRTTTTTNRHTEARLAGWSGVCWLGGVSKGALTTFTQIVIFKLNVGDICDICSGCE
jgi:hypothetical protein